MQTFDHAAKFVWEIEDMQRELWVNTTGILARLVIILAILGAADSVFAIEYDYDDLDRVEKVTYDDGSSVSFVYDKAGNVLERTAVPEPGAGLQMLATFVTLAGLTRRRRSQRNSAPTRPGS